jgi:hypothetical protein
MAKYFYEHDPTKSHVPRPIFPIKIGYSKTKKTTPPIRALLDRGADVCLLSKEIALWLGISFTGSEEQFSIVTANGATSQAVRKKVTLITEIKRYSCPELFCRRYQPSQHSPSWSERLF